MTNLDYFKTHALRVAKDQSALPLAAIRSAENTSTIKPDIHPVAGAYIHYGGVELADMLTLTQPTITETQRAHLAAAWYASCGICAKQLLFYVWRIISKEMRHGDQAKCDKAFAGGGFNPAAVKVVEDVCSSGPKYMECIDAAGHTVSVGDYVSAIEQHFRYGGWGGAFGGPKWADIALIFKRYIYGEVSAMIAADRAWTLVHNGGPIFNKGFYFKHHGSHLMEVLNAQAQSSVFSLGIDYLESNGDFDHPMNSAFHEFRNVATQAIQTVKPEYVPGLDATGGFKDIDPTTASKGNKPGKPGKVKIWNYNYETTKREAIG